MSGIIITMKLKLRKKQVNIVISIFVALASLVILQAYKLNPTANAHYYQNGDYTSKAQVESALRDYCESYWWCGLPWVTMRNSDYYNSRITVEYNQTEIPVYIRGAGYVRRGGCRHIDAYQVKDTSQNERAWLYDIKADSFYRGYACSGMTSQGHQVEAMLHIPNDGPGERIYQTRLKACVAEHDGCDEHIYSFRVTRKHANFSITGRSQIKVNKPDGITTLRDWTTGHTGNVNPGETILWRHNLSAKNAVNDIKVQASIGLSTSGPVGNLATNWASKYPSGQWEYPDNAKSLTMNNNSEFYTVFRGIVNDKPQGTAVYRVKPDDAGKEFCQTIAWKPKSPTELNSWGYTNQACAKVPFNYDLKPVVSTGVKSIQEITTKVDSVKGGITYTGPTVSKPTKSTLVRMIVKKGHNINNLSAENKTISISGNDWKCNLARAALGGVGDNCEVLHSNEGDVISNNKTVHDSDDDISHIPGLSLGDGVCYVMAVSGYNQGAGSDDFRYSYECLIVSHKPKVQFWGGDVRTGGKVRTNFSVKTGSNSEKITLNTQQLQANGIWRTGVDNNGQKVKENEKDLHWSLVCSKNDFTNTNGYQRGYRYNDDAVVDLPKCKNDISSMPANYQAVTVTESKVGSSWVAGDQFCDRNSSGSQHRLVGDDINTPWCGSGVWGSVSDTSRWIGTNVHGLHSSKIDNRNDLIDPSRPYSGMSGARNVRIRGNTYVFRLQDVLFSQEAIDSGDLELSFTGAVDNFVKVKINGYDMEMSPTNDDTDGWAWPGFHAGAWFSAKIKPGTVLKKTDNVLDFYIRSDWSHMGLRIDEASVSYTKKTDWSKYHGSWAEYGIISSKEVKSSSGAGVNAGPEGYSSSAGDADYNKLTFANRSKVFGHYGDTDWLNPAPTIPGLTKISLPAGSAVADINSLNSAEYAVKGNLRLATGGQSVIGKGKKIIIDSTGTVTINNNIIYSDDNMGNFKDLPILIIRAKNIIIDPNVTNIDAWLIAGDGYVSTCAGLPGNKAANWLQDLNSNVCNQKLNVNGPVVAGSLYLRRTFANAGHLGDPAEILNLRPDAYLAAYAGSLNSGAIKTKKIKELPPRF